MSKNNNFKIPLRVLVPGAPIPIVNNHFPTLPEKEEIKTTKEQEDQERKEAYEMAEKISGQIPYLNPGAILIFRYFPSRFTKGGLEKPEQTRKSEARNSFFGEILKISDLKDFSEEVNLKKELLVQSKARHVMFLATNAISGGVEKHPQIQIVAVNDVLLGLNDEEFKKFIEGED